MLKHIKFPFAFIAAISILVPIFTSCVNAPGDDLSETQNSQPAYILYAQQTGKTVVEISTAQDLVGMSADYAVNGNKYINYLYVLTNDIDMSGVTDFLPIGRNRDPEWSGKGAFNGTFGFCSEFDGQGYTIKNLSLNENVPADEYSGHYIALFDTISEKGVVKNVNVENININVPASAGSVIGENYTCAGFAVRVFGFIDNCHVQGTIYNPAGGGGGFVNTVDGRENTIIQNCSADVDITGSWGMGGFLVNSSQDIGYKDYMFKIYNCASFGSITAERYDGMLYYYDVGELGGFADKTYAGIFEKCHVQTPLIINDPAKYIGGFIANEEGDPITGREAQFIDCTYSPATTTDYIIGMSQWKNTHGDYGSAQFSPKEKEFKFG